MTTTTTTKRNTKGGDRPRNANDFYATPPDLAKAICEMVKNQLDISPRHIVEPSAGDGTFLRAAIATFPNAGLYIAIEPHFDLRSEAFHHPMGSFLSIYRQEWESAGFRDLDLIIGNPPFLLAESHVRTALNRLAPGGHLVFLLRASFLAGRERVNGLWSEYPPAHVWHVAPRPSFTGDGRTDGAEYAVVVWQKGYEYADYSGGWLRWSKTA